MSDLIWLSEAQMTDRLDEPDDWNEKAIADIRGVAPHLPEAERRPPPDRLRRAYTPMIWRAVPCHHCVSHSRFTTTDAAK